MDYQKLKEEIKEIAAIAADVPEPFRDKCFEILLNNLIGKPVSTSPLSTAAAIPQQEAPAASRGSVGADTGTANDGAALPKPSEIRVFMTKTGVTEDELKRVVMFDDGEIHFLREPAPAKIAQGQIEWALLLALKNAFEKNEFAVDPEDVRSICQEKGFYDNANFAANFKLPKNAELFRGPMKGQGEAQPLTSDGHTALARVIKSLAGA